MNREQYLAKRMRLCGTPPDTDRRAGLYDARGDALASSPPAFPPAVSLADHYRRFHLCASGRPAKTS